MYPWTDNGTDFTIPFYYFFKEEYKDIVYPAGAEYKTPFPSYSECKFDGSFPPAYRDSIYASYDRIKEEIINHFAYRQISSESPQRFLRHFHGTIRQNLVRWVRLLYSEIQLRPDDAIFNYDMTETSRFENIGESSGTTKHTNTNETTDTTEGNATATRYISDTPDGSVSDIETYMSEAGKDVTSDTRNGTNRANGTASGESSERGEASGESTLTRKGNIGVMTSAQIIGGYRDATSWSAWSVIFGDLEKHFMGVF